MRKPLEMRGWAVKHTAPDGKQRLSMYWFLSREHARDMSRRHQAKPEASPGCYTVVPVIVRERR